MPVISVITPVHPAAAGFLGETYHSPPANDSLPTGHCSGWYRPMAPST